jgi:hypothetical protein
MLLLVLMMACGTSSPPASIADCEAMEPSPERDECYAAFLPDRFAVDPMQAGELTERNIEDPLVRDFVYLQVTRDIDPAGGRWCERISATVVAERCRVLARRPHLQRARLGRGQASGAPGE